MPEQPIHVRKRLAGLATPIFVEVLLLMMLGAVDTIMLGRYSDNSVASAGMVNQLMNVVILFFGAVSNGASVLCSQYLGAREERSVTQVVCISILCALGVGLLFSALLSFGGRHLLELMDLQPELMPEAVVYIHIVGGGAFFPALGMTLSAVLRSAGLASYPMRVSMLINVLNVIGNYTLIFGHFGVPALGVAGAAISTITCRGVAVVLLFLVVRRKLLRHVSLPLLHPFPLDKLRKLLTVGLPATGEGLSYTLSQLTITYFINTLGPQALAARTYAANIIMFSFLFAWSLGISGSILVGHLIGERHKQAAYFVGLYCIKLAMAISFSIALITALAGRPLMSLISSTPEVIHMVALVLMIDVILEIGRAVNILCVNLLRAAGDVTYALIVGLIVMWSVATGLGYLFGITLGWGLAGMWLAFAMDENIRAVLLYRRWKSRIWMRRNLM